MVRRALLYSFFVTVVVRAADPPAGLVPFFQPPPQFAHDYGTYASPLRFEAGRDAATAEDWKRRRKEIDTYWRGALGVWPERPTAPKLVLGARELRGTILQHAVTIETAPGRIVEDAFLLIPSGKGPFPAAMIVFYDAATGIGRGKTEHRDFAWQLARRGFVTLSVGGDPNTYYPTRESCRIQPLAFHAFEATTCRLALAARPEVDAKRIGIAGHSYGGKWAMFASCLDDGFACAAWSDAGIVFDESRSNVNYWEPWYLGFDPALKTQRTRGIPGGTNPRTGPYAALQSAGRDLHELHALMAPRPFLVSGGAEDTPQRWTALNHAIKVNELLGAKHRVAMTNRKDHAPNAESNRQLCDFFEYALALP